MFFDTWYAADRVALLGTVAFVAVVVLLRLSRKRTLAKMNAFDLVVTVALGSTLVREDEVYQAVPAQGIGDLDQVDAVVLETDGSFSVITLASAGSRSALANVRDLTDQRR